MLTQKIIFEHINYKGYFIQRVEIPLPNHVALDKWTDHVVNYIEECLDIYLEDCKKEGGQ